MKEYPTIYIVKNDDGDPEAAFYERADAVTHCQKFVESWGHDMDDWVHYFRIYEVQVS